MRDFVRYCKIRVPGLIGISLTMLVFISMLYPDRIGAWFVGMTEAGQTILRLFLLLVSGILIHFYAKMVDRYSK